MNRIDRLFGITTLLQSRRHVTAEKIAEKFGISVRTVYRDIKALCEQGIPVVFEQNKGYCMMQGYFLPPVAFSSEEANALVLMEAIVYGFADRSIQEHYASALGKVKSVLRHSQKEKIETVSERTRMRLPSFVKNDYDHLSGLQQAISAQSIIRISYKNLKEETSTRELEPIGLIFYALHWHLIAWCHLRKEYRDFRVSRITNLVCLDQPFRKKKHIELAEYMKQLPANY